MNPTRFIVSFFLIFSSVCGMSAVAQSPAARGAGGTITGRVTARGKGLSGVTVTLRTANFGGPGQDLPQAKTDADGNYRITNVPIGSYFVMPVAPVFTVPNAGRFSAANQQVVITSASDSVEGIDFSLVRGGVLTGKVTDTDGRPLIEQAVSVQSADQNMQQGGPPAIFAGNSRTDDRGIYRIYGVPAGRYTVSVGAQQRFSVFSTVMGQQAYKQTFHPDATDASQATIVEVAEGAEVPNVDITVGRSIDEYSASGQVLDNDTNAPIPNVGFTLSVLAGGGDRQRAMGLMAVPVISDSNGQFRVDNLPPGRYMLSIAPQSSSGMTGQSSAFDVINEDVKGIEVRAVRGASISGVVALDGNQDPSVLSELLQFQVQVFVQGNGNGRGALSSAQTVPLNVDGSFQFSGLAAGTARLSLVAQDSTLQGAFKLLRTEKEGVAQPRGIQVNSGDNVAGVRLVAAYADGTVSGIVKPQGGAVPTGARMFARLSSADQSARNLGAAMVDERGHFLIQNVPAGTYTLTVNLIVPGSPGQRRGGPRQQAPISAQQQIVVTQGQVSNVTVVLDVSQLATPPAAGN